MDFSQFFSKWASFFQRAMEAAEEATVHMDGALDCFNHFQKGNLTGGTS